MYNLYILSELDISTRPPAGNLHGWMVKFDKYLPGWLALFRKSQADHCYGQVKDNFGLPTIHSYQPDWLVPEKVKIQPFNSM